jgi:aspartyl-tRNA(Asn)/glutamyl-tRNA(Gln) amidotransferase subunit C
MNLENEPGSQRAGKRSAEAAQPTVTLDHVLRVAELAHLELTVAEQTEMLRDLNSILNYVAQLNELDTSEVAAMAQVNEIFMNSSDGAVQGLGEALRADEPRASLDRNTVMAQAPDTDGVYFKVPKVIER